MSASTNNKYSFSECKNHAVNRLRQCPTYGLLAEAVNGIAGVTSPGYFEANAILDNPDMSATKGKTYIDTIQSYLNPRIYIALNLGNALSEHNVIDYSTSVYPNPSNNVISINNSNFIILILFELILNFSFFLASWYALLPFTFTAENIGGV